MVWRKLTPGHSFIAFDYCIHSSTCWLSDGTSASILFTTGGWDLCFQLTTTEQGFGLWRSNMHVLKYSYFLFFFPHRVVSCVWWTPVWWLRTGSVLLQCLGPQAATLSFLFYSHVQMNWILLPDYCLLWTLETHQEIVLFVTLETPETGPCTWILIGCRSRLLILFFFFTDLNSWIISCWACVDGEVSLQLVFRSSISRSCWYLCYVQVVKRTQLLWSLFILTNIYFLGMCVVYQEGNWQSDFHVHYSACSCVICDR